jgi:chromosome segregation ATPase
MFASEKELKAERKKAADLSAKLEAIYAKHPKLKAEDGGEDESDDAEAPPEVDETKEALKSLKSSIESIESRLQAIEKSMDDSKGDEEPSAKAIAKAKVEILASMKQSPVSTGGQNTPESTAKSMTRSEYRKLAPKDAAAFFKAGGKISEEKI